MIVSVLVFPLRARRIALERSAELLKVFGELLALPSRGRRLRAATPRRSIG